MIQQWQLAYFNYSVTLKQLGKINSSIHVQLKEVILKVHVYMCQNTLVCMHELVHVHVHCIYSNSSLNYYFSSLSFSLFPPAFSYFLFTPSLSLSLSPPLSLSSSLLFSRAKTITVCCLPPYGECLFVGTLGGITYPMDTEFDGMSPEVLSWTRARA